MSGTSIQLQEYLRGMKSPWPDRDFWDFLRGVKVETYNYSQIHTTRDVVFPDHPRVPTKPIEFKAESFQIVSSETLRLQMQAAINAMKDTPQEASYPVYLPPALYDLARQHYRNELEWFDKHYAVQKKIPKS